VSAFIVCSPVASAHLAVSGVSNPSNWNLDEICGVHTTGTKFFPLMPSTYIVASFLAFRPQWRSHTAGMLIRHNSPPECMVYLGRHKHRFWLAVHMPGSFSGTFQVEIQLRCFVCSEFRPAEAGAPQQCQKFNSNKWSLHQSSGFRTTGRGHWLKSQFQSRNGFTCAEGC
jgi:hypothetical protein